MSGNGRLRRRRRDHPRRAPWHFKQLNGTIAYVRFPALLSALLRDLAASGGSFAGVGVAALVSVGDPVYTFEDGIWRPRAEAKGPFPGQHAGATGGLQAAVMENWAADNDAGQMLQFSVYLHRPAPVAPVSVELDIVQSGRRLSVLRTVLAADGKACATAHGVFVRPVEIADAPAPPDEPFQPEAAAPYEMWFHSDEPWFWDTVEARRADDGTIWLRAAMPVVDPLPAMARVAAHADWISGLFRPDDADAPVFGGFPNADLTIHLSRLPESEWIGVFGTSHWHGNGVGVTSGQLRDTRGPIGWSAQSIVLTPAVGEDGSR